LLYNLQHRIELPTSCIKKVEFGTNTDDPGQHIKKCFQLERHVLAYEFPRKVDAGIRADPLYCRRQQVLTYEFPRKVDTGIGADLL
jgi:hypothetical protein